MKIKKIIAFIICAFIPFSNIRKMIRQYINNGFYIPNDIKLKKITDKDRQFEQKSIQEFRNSLKNININKYKIVSLGANCFVRTTLQKYGILSSPKSYIDGSEGDGNPGSLVFDLINTPLEYINYFLENNFKNYFDNLIYIKEQNWWRNDKFGFDFAHDKDCENSESGQNKLIERYKTRISRFNNVFNSNKELVFIRMEYNFNKDLIIQLYKNIERKMNNKKFHFIVLNFDLSYRKNFIADNIILFNVIQPCQKYCWYKEEYRLTPQGLLFEKNICEKIKRYLIENIGGLYE